MTGLMPKVEQVGLTRGNSEGFAAVPIGLRRGITQVGLANHDELWVGRDDFADRRSSTAELKIRTLGPR